MTVKTSISLTDAQQAYARELVEKGRFSSVSAVLQRGLDMLRAEDELHEAEVDALRTLLKRRAKAPTVSVEDGKHRTKAMIARKRAERGLQG